MHLIRGAYSMAPDKGKPNARFNGSPDYTVNNNLIRDIAKAKRHHMKKSRAKRVH